MITVHQDGEEIFRGRVLDDEKDTYNQKDVYCEGIRSYLNDSQAAPYTYEGTARGLLEKLILEHNEQMGEDAKDKHFTIGTVDAVDDTTETGKIENVAYWETFKEIDEKLLGAYGGYLRARHEGGVLYIDWLKEYSSAAGKQIRFGVNLLDLKDKRDTGDIFTILRPLGAAKIGDDGEYGDALTIASAHPDGLEYIVDEEAVQKYGRIWRTHTWVNEEDPAKLYQKGLEYMKIGAELRTITLKAIDMHFIDGSADAIRVGDKVHILTKPHGIDLEKVCCKIDIDLVNPENTTYTFGEPPRTLTDNTVRAEREIDSMTGYKGGGGGRGSVKQQLDGILRWAKVQVDQANANINLNAGEINSLTGRMSTAEIEILGMHAQIRLKASQEDVTDLGMRMSAAGIDIRGDIANIKLFATQETVDAMGKDMSDAWIVIDGQNDRIEANADEILLRAKITYVDNLIAEKIEAVYSDVAIDISEAVSTKNITVHENAWIAKVIATSASVGSLTIDGDEISKESKTLYKGGTISIDKYDLTVAVVDNDGNVIGRTKGIPSAWTFTPSSNGSISYLGY